MACGRQLIPQLFSTFVVLQRLPALLKAMETKEEENLWEKKRFSLVWNRHQI